MGSICRNTGCLLLDMAHTFLKTLIIGHLRYSALNQRIYKDNSINLTLLNRLNDAPPSDKKNKRERNKMDSKYPIIASRNIESIYTYAYYWQAKEYLITKRFSEKETDIVFKYYQNFLSGKNIQTIQNNNLSDKSTLRKKKTIFGMVFKNIISIFQKRPSSYPLVSHNGGLSSHLVRELYRGYGELRFGNVESLTVIH
ncbi:hypothetical protein J3Q64DRAFT_1706550 [Phycomyces blakesleeanus]